MTEMADYDYALIQSALLAYCKGHTPRTGPHGETCDEMGCAICNAGPEDAASDWYEQWLDPESDDFGPLYHVSLPFDPMDENEMREQIEGRGMSTHRLFVIHCDASWLDEPYHIMPCPHEFLGEEDWDRDTLMRKAHDFGWTFKENAVGTEMHYCPDHKENK